MVLDGVLDVPPDLPDHKVAIYMFRVGRTFVKVTGQGFKQGNGYEFDPRFISDLAAVAHDRVLQHDASPALRQVRQHTGWLITETRKRTTILVRALHRAYSLGSQPFRTFANQARNALIALGKGLSTPPSKQEMLVRAGTTADDIFAGTNDTFDDLMTATAAATTTTVSDGYLQNTSMDGEPLEYEYEPLESIDSIDIADLTGDEGGIVPLYPPMPSGGARHGLVRHLQALVRRLLLRAPENEGLPAHNGCHRGLLVLCLPSAAAVNKGACRHETGGYFRLTSANDPVA